MDDKPDVVALIVSLMAIIARAASVYFLYQAVLILAQILQRLNTW